MGELAEARRREAVMVASGAPLRWSATHPLPNANAGVQPAPGTRPELTRLERHYRIDINTIPPKIDERQWRLQIAGLVQKPLTFTLQDLQRYEPMHQFGDAVVHLQPGWRRSDRHHTLDGSEPEAITVRSSAQAGCDPPDNSLGGPVFRGGVSWMRSARTRGSC